MNDDRQYMLKISPARQKAASRSLGGSPTRPRAVPRCTPWPPALRQRADEVLERERHRYGRRARRG
ncbi:MAG: hypothetical protein ACLTSX_01770 [Collinsella sp.]